jgi:hypothetical protein
MVPDIEREWIEEELRTQAPLPGPTWLLLLLLAAGALVWWLISASP